MQNAGRLFRHRVWSYWHWQWQALRMVVDWVIAMYFVVPLLAVGIYAYYQAWIDPPAWFADVPAAFAVLPVVAVVLRSRMHLFLEPADQLFLRQNRKWMLSLRRFSAVYSVIVMIGSFSGMALIIFPFVYDRFALSVLQYVSVAAVACSMSVMTAIGKNRCQSLGMWKKWIALTMLCVSAAGALIALVVFSVHSPAASPLFAACCALLAWLLLRGWIQGEGDFFRDAESHMKAKLALTAFIASGTVKRKPLFPLKRPVVFPRSGPLMRKRSAENVLAEMDVKSFLRSGNSMRIYAQYTFIGMFAAAVVPLWVKAIVLGMMGLLLSYWLRMGWREFRRSEFARIAVFKKGIPYRASKKAIFLKALPSYVLISLAAALSAIWTGQVWPGILLFVAAIGWLIACSGMFAVYELESAPTDSRV